MCDMVTCKTLFIVTFGRQDSLQAEI